MRKQPERRFRDQSKGAENLADRMEQAMEEELREREARRLNLVLHGVAEPGQDIKNPRDRMEMDKEECERIFMAMRARTRKHQLRFCRRVGERGTEPRPLVIGVHTEDEKRHLLEKSNELRFTMYERVAVVPDLTKSQRKGEQRLRDEAERRNNILNEEDKERGLKWIVVGRRGEKRLIKGTEREDQRSWTGGAGGGRGGGGGGWGQPQLGGRGGRGGYERGDSSGLTYGGEGRREQGEGDRAVTNAGTALVDGGGGGGGGGG